METCSENVCDSVKPQFGITLKQEGTWFFQYQADGKFVWNPELITAFVEQVKLEMQKTTNV